jgi:hypothetical protein
MFGVVSRLQLPGRLEFGFPFGLPALMMALASFCSIFVSEYSKDIIQSGVPTEMLQLFASANIS